MAALTSRGFKVQPFKVGPDFIDPTHHTAICGRPSRNLDPFMMGERGVLETFGKASADADIAVIEGAMGLYDGVEGTEVASAAQVSKLLMAPVLLVVDASAMSRSACAVVKGFREFDSSVSFGGVVFNKVGGDRHRGMIEASLEDKALGWMPRKGDLEVGSRHLGLKMAGEVDIGRNAGLAVEEFCDVDGIIAVARSPGRLPDIPRASSVKVTDEKVKIGVAMDRAFCFYYQDNLDRLVEAGAELVFFSPMEGRLPEVDGIYLGGGYPELYAKELESSRCREDVKRAIGDGIPVYAECGGLMYLAEGITVRGETFSMTGALPARAEMTGRLEALGYVNAKAVREGPISPGIGFNGHEFHHSKIICSSDTRFALELSRGKGIMNGHDGICEHNAMGAYTHAYFTGEFASSLAGSMRKYARR
jgi:cobyrinic acid a,c-diamide synthase